MSAKVLAFWMVASIDQPPPRSSSAINALLAVPRIAS